MKKKDEWNAFYLPACMLSVFEWCAVQWSIKWNFGIKYPFNSYSLCLPAYKISFGWSHFSLLSLNSRRFSNKGKSIHLFHSSKAKRYSYSSDQVIHNVQSHTCFCLHKNSYRCFFNVTLVSAFSFSLSSAQSSLLRQWINTTIWWCTFFLIKFSRIVE